ncbi:MAG: glycosyltransferase [Gallionellaceae bacterium]
MKAGIIMSDAITTVSETYAKEILSPEYGCGLNGYLSQFKNKLNGIVNGIDTNYWNPKEDSHIPATFYSGKIAGKAACKQALQIACGLSPSTKKPLLTLISRLAEQKGIDLILANIERWMQCGYQLAVLGSGDPEMEQAFASFAQTYPRQMYFSNDFNEPLAHKIYAGGDMFLMPSLFEPCGLGQLIAMRYGNIPIVRSTGGLCDTVIDYMASKAQATGLHFSDLTPQSLANAVDQATRLYQQPRIWARIRNKAMNRDSSWDNSAKLYAKLYSELERT